MITFLHITNCIVFNCFTKRFVLIIVLLADVSIAGFSQTGPAGVGNSTTNKVWLKADAGFNQANNTPVGSWVDQSGNSFDARQFTANRRPIYRQNVLNGKPVLLFDRTGAIKYLEINVAGLSSVVSNSNTVYVVGAAWSGGTDNTTNAYQSLVTIPGYHSGIIVTGYPSATGIYMTNWLGSSVPGTAPTNGLSNTLPITQGSWYVFNKKITEVPAGSTQQGFVNGTLINSVSSGMQMTNYNNNIMRIGAAHISGSTYLWGLSGGIAEVIVFNTSLNDAQRVLVDNYLSVKYNLAISTDFFQGNDPSFSYDMQGIGTTDGTGANKHSIASNGKGLHLFELNSSLNAANEFLMSAHNSQSNAHTSQDLPAGGSSRWNRVWYVEKTGTVDAKLSFDFSDAGLSPEVDLANRIGNFKLLYKSTVGEAFAVVNNGSNPLLPVLENGDRLSFSLSDSQLSSGYYTVMVTESVDTSPVKKLFSGLITSTQWRTDQPYMITEPGFEGMYMYSYDDKYQIKDARWAENVNHTLGTFDRAGNKFRLTDMTYDPNGNILSLKRFDKDAFRQHSFNYTYKPNTNQLQNINGYTNAYTYNAVGQMIGEDKVEEGKDQFVDYDVTGKVRFVYSDALKKNKKVEYLYDDRGFRLAKVNYLTQRTTWYIRDASGNVVSINEQVGTPSGLFTDISWGSLSNVVVDENGNLTVAPGATAGTATSSTRLKPNQDGYFEYVIEDAGIPKDISFHQVGYSSAYLYRFNFYSGMNIITVRKGGAFQTRIDYVVGDVIKLARIGGNVHFYHNNNLAFTIAVSTAASLELSVALSAANAKVSNLAFKYTSDPTGDQFPMNNTEVPVYGSGKLGTYYPQQDASLNYEITDHLGNVRALLRENISIYTATMEDNGQQGESNPRNEETTYFQNITETVVTDARMNHTSASPGVVPNKAAYLFWNDTQGTLAEEKAIGPAIALRVNAGDAVDIEAWSRFERKNDYTHDFGLVALSALLGNTFATSGGFDGLPLNSTISNLEQALTTAAFPDDGGDDTRPFAYVNYILYDENMVYQSAGWRRVGDDAGFYPNEIGLPEKKPVRVAFEQPITINQSGYIYVWVSNQSKETRVWFDDLKVSYTQNIVVQSTDYGVWGDVLREQKTDEADYRFGYQGQFAEKDEETGWNHFELREYDPVIGRWTVSDPYRQYWTPYMGMGNNPINGVDPNGGEWIPDENGNLIAEKGDDVFTLMDYLGTSFEEASSMFYDLGNWNSSGAIENVTGFTLALDNVFTRSISNSTSSFTTDVFLEYERTGVLSTRPTAEDYYNCWGSAYSGTQGNEIKVGVGIPDGASFDALLTSKYNPTSSGKSQFGKTVLRFAGHDNVVQHGAVYYGRSHDGTTYVYTKNGWHIKPQVMKLNDLMHKIPSYGSPKGIKPSESGYYIPH